VKRGDVVTVALQGDYGKPRPAVIIQSDLFDAHPSVTLLPITSELRGLALFRVPLEPGDETGLAKPSEAMVDKIQTVAHAKLGQVIGRLGEDSMGAVSRALALFLGFA
jgi:mRNA interferase MazF